VTYCVGFDKLKQSSTYGMIFMTLILDLSPELEQYLLQSSEDRGVTMEALTLQVLTNMMNGQNQSLIKPGTVCEV
jgi:hypothetical protein